MNAAETLELAPRLEYMFTLDAGEPKPPPAAVRHLTARADVCSREPHQKILAESCLVVWLVLGCRSVFRSVAHLSGLRHGPSRIHVYVSDRSCRQLSAMSGSADIRRRTELCKQSVRSCGLQVPSAQAHFCNRVCILGGPDRLDHRR
jgi:hypothetical protein